LFSFVGQLLAKDVNILVELHYIGIYLLHMRIQVSELYVYMIHVGLTVCVRLLQYHCELVIEICIVVVEQSFGSVGRLGV